MPNDNSLVNPGGGNAARQTVTASAPAPASGTVSDLLLSPAMPFSQLFAAAATARSIHSTPLALPPLLPAIDSREQLRPYPQPCRATVARAATAFATDLSRSWWGDELNSKAADVLKASGVGTLAEGEAGTHDEDGAKGNEFSSFHGTFRCLSAATDLLARDVGPHLLPIEVVYEACLAGPIRSTNVWLGRAALLVLLHEHHLLELLSSLREYFLGASADFTTALITTLYADLRQGGKRTTLSRMAVVDAALLMKLQ